MAKKILAIDQSTQGTKVLLLQADGTIEARRDLPHKQYVNDRGWVGHDMTEIWQNLCQLVKTITEETNTKAADIAAVGISNQRETSAAWNREPGEPLGHAIVWQCARAKDLCARIAAEHPEAEERIPEITGLPVSPYFPAPKWAWMIENRAGVCELMQADRLALGTMDSWLVYKMTGGRVHATDGSNASRTGLFDLRTLAWSDEACKMFGIDQAALPQVVASDGDYSTTTFDGALDAPVPIRAVLGDSHAALFGQGCHTAGLAKATYGTGSSVMMNIGDAPQVSRHGLVTSLAWQAFGKTQYVLEGNINYTGATITWLKDQLKLIQSAGETESLAKAANPEDHSQFVPAFTGLGAPWWENDAEGLFTGLTRTTGKNELVRAVLDSIACQIEDIVAAMEQDTGKALAALRVDGGPTKNAWLMQRQADFLAAPVDVPNAEELSALGAGYLAGIAVGFYDKETIFQAMQRKTYKPQMAASEREEKLDRWHAAVDQVLAAARK